MLFRKRCTVAVLFPVGINIRFFSSFGYGIFGNSVSAVSGGGFIGIDFGFGFDIILKIDSDAEDFVFIDGEEVREALEAVEDFIVAGEDIVIGDVELFENGSDSSDFLFKEVYA